MAGEWIKMRADLFTHPKVVRISSALKADTLRTVGGLMSAWCLFDAHSLDGSLEGYTSETLDSHLRWPGFAAAMIAVDWLADDGEALVLPEFDTHNGASAKRRAQDADRKKEVRKTSASQADKMRTREEKRREEKKEQKQEQPTPAKPRKPKAAEQTLPAWLAALPADEDALPADDPLVTWATQTGIPPEWLGYAWSAFEDKYGDGAKTYTDWRAVFRKAVKGDWLKVWRMTPAGPVLTTVGEQLRRAA